MDVTPTDYAAWQHQDLVKRVQDLEQKLREQTQLAQQTIEPVASEKYKKPRKKHSAFDPSKYSTRKIALKFAYLGAQYNGLEHHANNTTPVPTIEEVLWRALRKTRLIIPQHKPGQSEDEVCWDGCEYSKCGRTDKGVSAFSQVVSLRVRSARPVPRSVSEATPESAVEGAEDAVDSPAPGAAPFDHIRDELPYCQLLNKVLPPEIRVLAWAADLPSDFDARFSCRERRYRYFFTNPCFVPSPGASTPSEGWLDIGAMQSAARKYEGLHDFRNFCQIDPGKQLMNFERRIYHAGIHAVETEDGAQDALSPKLYYFEVRGNAFLWHQVRHLVAILFLVGQGLEKPDLVDDLLDVAKTPGKPHYYMASDVPLVLWECIFPDLSNPQTSHYKTADSSTRGFDDAVPWIYAGSSTKGVGVAKDFGKYGPGGIMESLWSSWRSRKIEEVLSNQLMKLVAAQDPEAALCAPPSKSTRIFDGDHDLRNVGPYTPVLKRDRMASVDEIYARWNARRPNGEKGEAVVGQQSLVE